MRIISGKLKGKPISFLKNLNTRPLKDSVKESIFNIIIHSNSLDIEIKDSNILDLYSGVGSFGLECISRGANKVTFIEQNKLACETLKKNLDQLSLNNKATLINDNVENIFLKNKKFDIFFFDPPFADNKYIKILSLIKKNNLFEKKTPCNNSQRKKFKRSFRRIFKNSVYENIREIKNYFWYFLVKYFFVYVFTCSTAG